MIDLRGLSARFGDAWVVQDLSLRVASGEVLALVGGSGSGKSTTLKMINRLVEPAAGSVHIDGLDVSTVPLESLRRSIGYVFQRVGLFPHLTVAENLAVPLELARRARETVTPRLVELMGLVELDPSLLGRYPEALSGGQQQRVGVARALAAAPRLMLLDEPFGALDPLTRDRLQQTFIRLRRSLGLTAIFVTHDMAEALIVADRIAVLRAGRLIQVGTAAELVAAPSDPDVTALLDTPRRHAEAFLALRGTGG